MLEERSVLVRKEPTILTPTLKPLKHYSRTLVLNLTCTLESLKKLLQILKPRLYFRTIISEFLVVGSKDQILLKFLHMTLMCNKGEKL